MTGGGSFTVAGSAVYRGSGFKEILGFVCLLTSILGDGERMFGHGENTHCSEPVQAALCPSLHSFCSLLLHACCVGCSCSSL